jgi:hypothetical protein
MKNMCGCSGIAVTGGPAQENPNGRLILGSK